jgi:hypothetical protein
MMLNIFRYQIPYLQYNLCKDYIAKNLCIYKSQKNNCCHGKCYLKQQLKKIKESNGDRPTDHSNSNDKKQINEDKEFFRSLFQIPLPAEKTVILPVNIEACLLQGYNSTIFVPPNIF